MANSSWSNRVRHGKDPLRRKILRCGCIVQQSSTDCSRVVVKCRRWAERKRKTRVPKAQPRFVVRLGRGLGGRNGRLGSPAREVSGRGHRSMRATGHSGTIRRGETIASTRTLPVPFCGCEGGWTERRGLAPPGPVRARRDVIAEVRCMLR